MKVLNWIINRSGVRQQFYDIAIIGTGIAGSVLAYNLEKKGINYFICTAQSSPLSNTSAMSNAHCRTNVNLNELVKLNVKKFDENKKRMRQIYHRVRHVKSFFDELGIEYEEKTFGIIPKKGNGKEILEKLQSHTHINTNTELIDFKKKKHFEIKLSKNGKNYYIASNYLVLATGGYGGTFKHTNNYKYKSYHVFDIAKKNDVQVINEENIFRHPFGYNKGKQILKGEEASNGKFVNSKGKKVFSKKINKIIKENNYHENFDIILKEIDKIQKNDQIFFVDENMKIEINPTIHYTAGGIKCNKIGEAYGINGLFVIGECRADGSKNGGRLPGYPYSSAIIDSINLARLFEKEKNKLLHNTNVFICESV